MQKERRLELISIEPQISKVLSTNASRNLQELTD